MLEPGSFDAYKNAAVPMIVMLSYLELDIEISDIGIETMESDDCKEMSRSNEDANNVLAVIWEGARFSHKNE